MFILTKHYMLRCFLSDNSSSSFNHIFALLTSITWNVIFECEHGYMEKKAFLLITLSFLWLCPFHRFFLQTRCVEIFRNLRSCKKVQTHDIPIYGNSNLVSDSNLQYMKGSRLYRMGHIMGLWTTSAVSPSQPNQIADSTWW